mgnify:CR=1 FL=1
MKVFLHLHFETPIKIWLLACLVLILNRAPWFVIPISNQVDWGNFTYMVLFSFFVKHKNLFSKMFSRKVQEIFLKATFVGNIKKFLLQIFKFSHKNRNHTKMIFLKLFIALFLKQMKQKRKQNHYVLELMPWKCTFGLLIRSTRIII